MSTTNSPGAVSPTADESQRNSVGSPSSAAVASAATEGTPPVDSSSVTEADPVNGEGDDAPAPDASTSAITKFALEKSDSLLDLLQDHEKIGDWNELLDKEPVPERPPSIPSPSTLQERKASTSSANTVSKQRGYHSDLVVEFHEPFYAYVNGIDFAASKLEIFYYFGGPGSVTGLYLYTKSPNTDATSPQMNPGENQQKEFSGEVFMQLSGLHALIDVLKKDRTDLLSRPVNVFHVDPDTLNHRRYSPTELENARQGQPRAGRYQSQHDNRSSPSQAAVGGIGGNETDFNAGGRFRRDNGDVRAAMQNRNFGTVTHASSTTPPPLAPKPSSASIFGQAKPVDQKTVFEKIQTKIETEKRMATVPVPPLTSHSSSSVDMALGGADTTGVIRGPPPNSLTRQSSSSSSVRYSQQQTYGGLQQRTYPAPPPPVQPQYPVTKILTHDVGAAHPPQHRAPHIVAQPNFRPPYHQHHNSSRQPSTPPSSSSPNVPVPLNQCNPHQQAPPSQFGETSPWGVSAEVEKNAPITEITLSSTPENLPHPMADECCGVQKEGAGRYRGGPSGNNRPYPSQHQYQQNHPQQRNPYQGGKTAHHQAEGRRPYYASQRKDSEEYQSKREPDTNVDSDPTTGRGEAKMEKRGERTTEPRINRTTSDDRTHRQSSDHPPYAAKGHKKGSLGARSSLAGGGQGGAGSNSLRKEEPRKGSDGDEKKEGDRPTESGRPPLSKENSNESRSNRPHIRSKEINQVRNFIQHDGQALTKERGVGGQKPRDGADRGDTRPRRVGGGMEGGGNRPLPYNRGGGSGRGHPRNFTSLGNNRRGSTDNMKDGLSYRSDKSKDGAATGSGKVEEDVMPTKKSSGVSKFRADEISADSAPKATPAPHTLKTVRSDSTPSFSVNAEESTMNKAKAGTGRANSAEKALDAKQKRGKDGAAEEGENGEGEKKSAGGKTNAKSKKKATKRGGKEDASGSPVITSNKFTALSSMD